MGRGPKSGREKQVTGHQNPCGTRWQPRGPQLQSHNGAHLVHCQALRPKQALFSELSREDIAACMKVSPVLYLGNMLHVFMTKHVHLQQAGLISFQFGLHRRTKGAWACGLWPVCSQEAFCKGHRKPFLWRSCQGRHAPMSFLPLPAPPNPHFGVAICFYKTWSFSKDIQFPLLLFSCHSQLKSINAPE